MKAASHRLGQGIRALLAFATSPDLKLARQNLSPCENAAFLKMARAEQLHSLNVLRRVLLADKSAPHALKAAALTHDVGKSRYQLAVWQKTISVLLKSFAPGLSARLSREETLSFWRAPFTVREHHPKWSAQILRECGSDEEVIWLAQHHQEDAKAHQCHRLHPLLVSLQRADDSN